MALLLTSVTMTCTFYTSPWSMEKLWINQQIPLQLKYVTEGVKEFVSPHSQMHCWWRWGWLHWPPWENLQPSMCVVHHWCILESCCCRHQLDNLSGQESNTAKFSRMSGGYTKWMTSPICLIVWSMASKTSGLGPSPISSTNWANSGPVASQYHCVRW